MPADAIDGGFLADPDTSRSIEFLKRRMGVTIALQAKPEDRIIVAAYDRLIGSSIDCSRTLTWALTHKIHLVIMDLRIDMSTNHGRMICQIIAAVKENERLEIGRRIKESLAHRREKGLPTTNAPIGYQIKKIIPAGSNTPIKYYMPWKAERDYARMIVAMHDEQKLSFLQIGLNIMKNKIIKPRSGKVCEDKKDCKDYYHACKKDWPLHGGVQWKAPSYKFKIVSNNTDVINLNRASA